MRHAKALMILLATSAATPAAAQAVYSTPSFGGPRAYDRVELQSFYFYRLNNLREQALRQQAADGGTLSAASRAELQRKLDRINATRVRDARLNDWNSLDGFGVKRRSRD